MIAALFDEGDEVIIPTPAWVSFAAMVAAVRRRGKVRAVFRRIRLHARARRVAPRDYAAHAQPSISGSLAVDNRLAPCTGLSGLTAIARGLVDTDIWVMSDDVYEHIAYTGLRRTCCASSRH